MPFDPSTLKPALWVKPDAGVTTSAGYALGAASFTAASNQRLLAPSTADTLAPAGSFGFGGWFNLASIASSQYLFGKGTPDTGTASEYVLFFNSGVGSFLSYFGATGQSDVHATGNVTLAAGTWYFVVAWYDSVAQTVNLTINNGGAASTAWANGPVVGTHPVYLGFNGGSVDEPFGGQVNSIFLLNSVPTSGDRTWLYNAGSGRVAADLSGAPTGFAAKVQAWWDCTENAGTRVAQVGATNLGSVDAGGPLTPGFSSPGIARLSGLTSSPQVTAWADQSGGGHTLTPVSVNGDLVPNVFGALSAVRLRGQTGSQLSTAATLLKARGFSVFALLKPATDQADSQTVLRFPTTLSQDNTVTPAGDLVIGIAKGGNAAFAGTSPYVSYAAGGASGASSGSFTTQGLPGVILAITSAAGTSAVQPASTFAWQNGGAPLTLSVVGEAGGTGATASLVGGGTIAGRNFDGWIGELIVFDHALSTVDVNNVLGYLSARSGLAVATATGGLTAPLAPADPATNPAPGVPTGVINGAADKTLVAMGDSIVSGLFLADPIAEHSYPAVLAGLLGASWNWVNTSQGGRQTVDMLNNVNAQALAYFWYQESPWIVLVEEGVNSIISGGLTASQAYAQMATLVGILKANGAKVLLVSTPTCTVAGSSADYVSVQQPAYDALATANSAGADAVVLWSQTPLADPTTLRTDGAHPNQAGANAMAAYLEPIVAGMAAGGGGLVFPVVGGGFVRGKGGGGGFIRGYQ